jgi:DNA-directed RNA polymerase specialized sigma24 family protein
MTEIQKKQIHEMRRYGCTYKHIASALSLNAGTVKTYCVRAVQKGLDILPSPMANSLCKQCGSKRQLAPNSPPS